MSKTEDKKKLAFVYLTRVQSFASSHRLNNQSMDAQTNEETFGKCNNTHGHNYKVEVTVKGVVNADTGMVMNINELKDIINETVMNNFDHKNIDVDVDYFRENHIISTAENIVSYIWSLIEKKLPKHVYLHCIKMHETDNCFVEYRGEYSE